MRRKRRDKTKKIITICLVSIVFLVSLFLLSKRESNYLFLEKGIKDISSFIEKIFSPRVDVNYTSTIEGINSDLEKQVNELKKLLNMREDSKFNLISANVISRNKDYWYSELVIDKGIKDGIDIDMAVITSSGLIGRITKTANYSSTIQLITSNNNMKISVSVNHDSEEYYGILSGYDFEDSSMIVSNVDKNSVIDVGDSVITNGLGSLFPTGIQIGNVVKVEYDELGLSKIVKIKSETKFNNIRFVGVIGRGE